METNTKEHIKNRMIKNAAQMWGVQASDIETSFDPIVTLLIGACAAEIEKIGGEIDSSQTRITEKVVQLMTPENANGPSLAHGILFAEPDDEFTIVKPEYLFSYRKEIAYKNTSLQYKDLFFSPIRDFKLVDASISYLATGDSLIEFPQKKSGLNTSIELKKSQLNPSTLYLGLSSALSEIPIDGISLYFDLKHGANEALFYHHLRNANWSTVDKEINVVSGFETDVDVQASKLRTIFENVSDKTNTIAQQISSRYEKHYITLQVANPIKDSDFEELDATLESNGIKKEEALCWVKIEFPTVISNEVLRNVKCSLNTFPVVNRKLNSFTYTIKEFINILPIKSEDLFFDIKSITNTDGDIYAVRNKDGSLTEKGTFVLRGNSVAKLDKRKAREYILHLIALLKDESAAFSFLNNDFLRGNLKTLNQATALLEKKVLEASNELLHTNYLTLKPFKSTENLLVEFWTTAGSEANNIKSGSKIPIYKGVGVKQGTSQLITTTHGGKNDLSVQDRLNSTRRSLLSKERIVTKEDVKALCFEMYGDKISAVEIQSGYQKNLSLKKGLLPCLEIVLSANESAQVNAIEWESLGSNLLYYLKKKSVNVLPYRIKIIH